MGITRSEMVVPRLKTAVLKEALYAELTHICTCAGARYRIDRPMGFGINAVACSLVACAGCDIC